jgi:hypothetical protein
MKKLMALIIPLVFVVIVFVFNQVEIAPAQQGQPNTPNVIPPPPPPPPPRSRNPGFLPDSSVAIRADAMLLQGSTYLYRGNVQMNAGGLLFVPMRSVLISPREK